MKFSAFKQAVANQFAGMQAYPLFRTTAKGDDLWDAYLNAFPAGSNPMYRERTAHDCGCCRQFIRTVGNIVALKEGKMVSIWDGLLPKDEPEYQIVSRALSAVARSYPIENVFLHTEKTVGTNRNFEQLLDGQQEWQHFFVALPPAYVVKKDALGLKLSETRGSNDVFRRALLEISFDAIDTTLELIDQNTLYRGAEFKAPVELFKKMKLDFNGTDEFIWDMVAKISPSILRIRNSAIGTLLVDLSEGRDLDEAVASFESKVAPTNYKRPSAIVTQRMIDDAKKKVEELGLTPSLMRRYATIDDVTVNNVLFVDRSSSSPAVDDDVFGGLAAAKASPKNLSKVMDVPIEKFLKDIVPTATSIELLLDNGHVSNLVSLIAPIHPTAPQLFKWNNPFSWAYNGQLADSMKEKVKAAGGNIEADVCCRLAWEYTDDLDLHLKTPMGQVYFANRQVAGWMLDVDANGGNGMREHPVENIFIKNRNTLRDGEYTLFVHNFSRRSSGIGFEAEIDINGTVHAFSYPRVIRDRENVTVAAMVVKDGSISVFPGAGMEKNTMQKEAWNVQTNTFQKVSAIMPSPNYWDEQAIGNKHWFFMLEGCRNEGQARGFFNEFLINDLTPHRKVLEMVGAKVQTEQAQHQLSGVGFSSTQSNRVLCRVKGSFNRMINIIF